jgi:hypothetical protein
MKAIKNVSPQLTAHSCSLMVTLSDFESLRDIALSLHLVNELNEDAYPMTYRIPED